MSHYKTFVQLHQQTEPFLLGNAWNVSSAQALEKAGYTAIGTSSAAIAHSLGYSDGEQMPFSTLSLLVSRMAASINLPLSVDLGSGYGQSVEEIAAHLAQLHQIGVVGINLEDSEVGGETRTLQSVQEFTQRLRSLKRVMEEQDISLFLNVRTDSFLLGREDALEETLIRIKLYQKAGADGLFVPGLVKLEEICEVVAATQIPLNIMCLPGLPSFAALAQIGVKRISMGNWGHQAVYHHMEELMRNIIINKSFSSLYGYAN